jgi:hypothetical protein
MFFFFKDFTLMNESIWFIYDKFSVYLKRNYMIESSTTRDIEILLEKNIYKDNKFKKYVYNNEIIDLLILVNVLAEKKKNKVDLDSDQDFI